MKAILMILMMLVEVMAEDGFIADAMALTMVVEMLANAGPLS